MYVYTVSRTQRHRWTGVNCILRVVQVIILCIQWDLVGQSISSVLKNPS